MPLRGRTQVRSRGRRWIAAGAVAACGILAACSGEETSPSENTSGTGATGGSAAGSGGAGSGVDAGSGASAEGGAGATDTGTGDGGANAGATNAGGTGGAPSPDCRVDGDGTTTLVFVNRCSATLTFRGSDVDGGTLAPGAFACADIGSSTEVLSAKRYWGFVGEDPGGEHHTLAEFTFNTDFNDFDWYNISHVDAFNLPMQIAPAARPECETLTCAEDLLADCPEVGRYEDAGGNLTSCVSPDRDDGQSTVALYFEACDDAYAWSGDDANGDDPSPVRACAGEDWTITFCPEDEP